MNKPYIHTYCVLMLGDRGISQTSIAANIGVSMEMVNQVLMGKKISTKVQQAIAEAIGLSSWQDVEERALLFADLLSVTTNHPKAQYLDSAETKAKRRLA